MSQTARQEEVLNPPEFSLNVTPRGHVFASILDTIGATPLAGLPRLAEEEGLEATILAKLEFFNPLGSVKDRIAYGMIEDAERSGRIAPGKTVLVEPTSGNTGIGLAFIAAAKGYRLILTMPESMSIERRKMLALLGAELVLTPKEKGMKGAIEKAQEIIGQTENAWMPGQFINPANPAIHAHTTAKEIWEDTQGRVDILVSGIGTGGTLTGVAEVIKKKKPDFKAIALEPTDSAVLSGGAPGSHKIQGLGAGFVPDTLDTSLIDEVIRIDDDAAFEMSRRMARLEGIPGGISAGAAFVGALQVAKRQENKGKTIVTIIPDFAERYLSTPLFEGLGA